MGYAQRFEAGGATSPSEEEDTVRKAKGLCLDKLHLPYYSTRKRLFIESYLFVLSFLLFQGQSKHHIPDILQQLVTDIKP